MVNLLVMLRKQLIEMMRQSKDNMIVGNGQQLALPIQDPPLTVCHLALGAMPVATGVITDCLYAARCTDRDMSAQRKGPAQGQGPKRLPDLSYRIILLFKCRSMKMNDIANFICRPQRTYSLSNGLCTCDFSILAT